MNTPAIRSTLLSTLGVALALGSGSGLATSFRITDLGTLGGSFSEGTDLNAAGQVTGHSFGVDNSSDTAFLWDGTAMQDLGELERTGGSAGLALNDSGQVTGGASVQLFNHAFLWDGTTVRDLGTLVDNAEGFSFGVALNASGQVTGSSGQAIGTTGDVVFLQAFLWDGTTMQDLGTLGGTNSSGSAINDAGQVTGRADTTDGARHAFLWDGTTMVDLGTLGGTDSSGSAISVSGQVTGFSETTDGTTHAFLWDGTTMLDLGTLGGSSSAGVAINDSGQVTGDSFIAGDAAFRAFLWDGTTLYDLNALIDPADPLQPNSSLSWRAWTSTISDRSWPTGSTVELASPTRTSSHPSLRCPNPVRSRCSAWASSVLA